MCSERNELSKMVRAGGDVIRGSTPSFTHPLWNAIGTGVQAAVSNPIVTGIVGAAAGAAYYFGADTAKNYYANFRYKIDKDEWQFIKDQNLDEEWAAFIKFAKEGEKEEMMTNLTKVQTWEWKKVVEKSSSKKK